MVINDLLPEGAIVLRCMRCPRKFIYLAEEKQADEQAHRSPPRHCRRCRRMNHIERRYACSVLRKP